MGTSKNFAIETSPAHANLQAHKIKKKNIGSGTANAMESIKHIRPGR
ncbi:unnamed protein product [Ixodes pacificus]